MDEKATKEVHACYAIEDNKSALDCLRRLVATAQKDGSCTPRLVLFTMDQCIPCSEEKAVHKNDIASGLVEVANLDTVEGRTLAEQAGVEFVPALVVLDCNGKSIDV